MPPLTFPLPNSTEDPPWGVVANGMLAVTVKGPAGVSACSEKDTCDTYKGDIMGA